MPGRRMSEEEARQILAKELSRIAFEHDMRRPYVTADYIIAWARENGWEGPVPNRSTIADYFRGKAAPSRGFIALFAAALGLSEEEERQLAWANTFPFSRAVA